MKSKITKLACLVLILVQVAACKSKKEEAPKTPKRSDVPVEFDAYWNTIKSEVSTFDLFQSRYGELHHGEAVLVFSRENFSRTRQVHTDKKSRKKGEIIQVLKLQKSLNFNSGIESHGIMNTAYTPISKKEGPYALKVVCTLQEWPGQSFTQLNLDANKYNIQLRSYLETEGDINNVALLTIPEDQLWCTLRINPKDLPIGQMQIIPGMISSRFRSKEIVAMPATMALTEAGSTELPGFTNMMKYSIHYNSDDRFLEIYFDKNSPYEIFGWKETYTDGSGEHSKKLTSTAVRKKIMNIDFWNRNQDSNLFLRDSLGLSVF